MLDGKSREVVFAFGAKLRGKHGEKRAPTHTVAALKHDGRRLLLQGFNQILLALFANGAPKNTNVLSLVAGMCRLMKQRSSLPHASSAEII